MGSLYLDNLEEYINDDNKIVSYKWLSQMLNVCSNTSKQMLYHFSENHKKKSSDYELELTYLISGIFQCPKIKKLIHRVCIVRDVDLEAVKSKFNSISSIHIYSIQRSKLKDLNLLCFANYEDKDKLNRNVEHSGIVCSAAKLRKDLPAKENLMEKKSHAILHEKAIESKSLTSTLKKSTPEIAKKKVGGVSSLFSKQSAAKSTVPTNDNKENKVVENKNVSPKATVKVENKDKTVKKGAVAAKKGTNVVQKGGISSFFKKSDSNSPVLSIKNENTKKDVKVKVETKADIPVSPIKRKGEVKKEPKKEVKATSPVKKVSKGKRKYQSEKPLPKRSRIKVESDSSDDENDNSSVSSMNEEPALSPPPAQLNKVESSDEEVEVLKPEVSNSGIAGKRRKLVDKTYMDDDGFIVTKKEYEYVDINEEEEKEVAEELKAKEEVKQKPKPITKKSPVKTKQSSIMSFFKAK